MVNISNTTTTTTTTNDHIATVTMTSLSRNLVSAAPPSPLGIFYLYYLS